MLHAAGHSPGHLAFSWPERSFAIVGDAVATWPQLCPGWHAFNLNKKQHHVTLQRLAALEADDRRRRARRPDHQGAQDALHELASKPVP